jgi:hypothetical protein
VEIVREEVQLAVHSLCLQQHQALTIAAHHAGIPTVASRTGKTRLSLTVSAPQVEVRSLAAYEELLSLEEVA